MVIVSLVSAVSTVSFIQGTSEIAIMEIAEAIAKKMRRARGSNGERLFIVSEFLTAQQVASFSSGMAAKIKQQTTPEETLSDQDILAMEDEQNFCNGCIVFAAPSYDQYDIYSMVKDKTLGNLKLCVLKLMCENLNISLPHDQRKKAPPYISLLEDLVKTYTCSTN